MTARTTATGRAMAADLYRVIREAYDDTDAREIVLRGLSDRTLLELLRYARKHVWEKYPFRLEIEDEAARRGLIG